MVQFDMVLLFSHVLLECFFESAWIHIPQKLAQIPALACGVYRPPLKHTAKPSQHVTTWANGHFLRITWIPHACTFTEHVGVTSLCCFLPVALRFSTRSFAVFYEHASSVCPCCADRVLLCCRGAARLQGSYARDHRVYQQPWFHVESWRQRAIRLPRRHWERRQQALWRVGGRTFSTSNWHNPTEGSPWWVWRPNAVA